MATERRGSAGTAPLVPGRGPILVAAAWDPELSHLREQVPGTEGPATARRAVVSRAVGVGLVEAAVGTARALALLRPRALIFVGTAGRYPDVPAAALAVGGAALVRRVVLLASAVARGEAYLPPPLPDRLETDRTLRRALRAAWSGQRLPAADVACPLGITRSLSAARRAVQATDCTLENLEAFAAGRAAAAAGIPYAAVLGVSNAVGPAAHREWRAHGAAAAAAACAVVQAWLRAPSPR